MINQWNRMEVPYFSGNLPYVCMYIYICETLYEYVYISYIQKHIHTCMHTYMHACMHAYIRTYIHTYIRTCRSGHRSWVAEGRMDHSVS